MSPKLFQKKESRDHFHEEMFHGFDFDGTMLRIGSMNMTLHGVDNPDIRYKDSLAQESTAKDLLAVVKTKKTGWRAVRRFDGT
jgi:type I restriction enzyme M protein